MADLDPLTNRVWAITVGTKIGSLAVGLKVTGLRVEFDIKKDIKPKPNDCTIKIYNLSREHRGALAQQKKVAGLTAGIPVRVEAGYKAAGPILLFSGDLRFASSQLEGATWVTIIESGDGEAAKQNARINIALGPNTTADQALGQAVKALGLSQGNTAKFLAKLRASGTAAPGRITLSGSAWLHAYQIARANGLEFSVQDGAVQLTEQGRVLPGRSVKLSPGHGLIGSPTVDHKGVLSAVSLLQDGLEPGRLVVMDAPSVKGNFRIERVQYEGDSHGKPWYANIEGKRY
jgi:hypothetical protein